MQILLQEKDERISDLKRETETLSTFAHYFKSLEYRRLEASIEDIKTERSREESPAREPRRAHKVRSEKEQTESPRQLKKELIRKTCKNCGKIIETNNPRKETCSDKCRAAFFRKKK